MSIRIQRVPPRAAALLAVLVLVPVASAGRHGPGSSAAPHRPRATAATCHQYCGAARPSISAPVIVRTAVLSAPESGFEWLDAAIGFGVACGAMLLAAGAYTIKRRARAVPAETAS
jgi:hypothetical protein